MEATTDSGLASLRITLIGGGNMARGLIGGLLGRGVPPSHITVAEPAAEARAALNRDYGVHVTDDNLSASATAQVVVLAVKPQQMAAVARALAPALVHRPLVISVAAGIVKANDVSIESMVACTCGGRTSDIQAMPAIVWLST